MEIQTQLEIVLPYSIPLFFAFFLLIYLLAYFVVFRSWTPETRPEGSSCLISLFHGTPAVFFATFSLVTDPGRSFSSLNTPTQDLTLDYSIAYFLMDLTHYLVFYPRDVLFIAHHLATLFVFLTCRYFVTRGACFVLTLLILAEVTSLCQNVWTLAAARRGDNQFAKRVYDVLSPPFYVFYSVVRGLAGPYFVLCVGVYYYYHQARGGDVIPTSFWVSWMVVVVTAIAVSVLWIANLWVELFRERRGKLEQKKLR